MLFLLALCAIYTLSDWRKIAALVTSFTIGHSITLALSTFNLISFDAAFIEFLIPVTILATCIINLFRLKGIASKQATFISVHNALAVFFGLIHGMGFSNYLKSLLGKNSDTWLQLLAFNIGIEIGQLMIVTMLLVIAFLAMNVFNTKKRDWIIALSSAAAGISLLLIIETSIF
jgi:hypothetical protein